MCVTILQRSGYALAWVAEDDWCLSQFIIYIGRLLITHKHAMRAKLPSYEIGQLHKKVSLVDIGPLLSRLLYAYWERD